MVCRSDRVIVVGGGLAGSEAAWQLACRGVKVELYEMRPVRQTGAHHSDRLAELVCSNSLGSYDPKSAPALLKSELKLLSSRLLEIAWQCRVPAGQALAVDRDSFAQMVTESVLSHPNIDVRRGELEALPEDGIVIVATGPLTSSSLSRSIASATGTDHLHFFDAASPIVARDSIDMGRVFAQSRYGKGDGEYLNCPMSRSQYVAFREAIAGAERVDLKDFEKDTPYFEACLPVEVIASRGLETLRWGPLKPVGLIDPATGRRPHAVVQLRQDNAAADLYNMVGFQTNLKWGEQKRVFRLIPGLEQAEFVRLGVMHRNTFLNSPVVLERTLQMKNRPNVLFGGQITGVEGYTESIATGLVASLNAYRLLSGDSPVVMPPDTMIGALIRYITSANPRTFQPINSNWGLFDTPPAWARLEKSERRARLAARAIESMEAVAAERALVPA